MLKESRVDDLVLRGINNTEKTIFLQYKYEERCTLDTQRNFNPIHIEHLLTDHF